VPFREGTNRGAGVLNDPLWCVPRCGTVAALVRAFSHQTMCCGVLGVPFREGTNRGVVVLSDPPCGSLWCVPSRTIHGGVVCVPFREDTNRGMGVLERSALRIEFGSCCSACRSAAMVLPWCVPSRTIHGGEGVTFREGTNRGMGVLERSTLRIALVRVVVRVMVRPRCVPSRTIHDGLVVSSVS